VRESQQDTLPQQKTNLCIACVAWLKSDKNHIFTPTAGVRSSIFPKLCMVLEDVKIIKKVSIIFQSNAVFPTGCTEKLGVNDGRAVTQQ